MSYREPITIPNNINNVFSNKSAAKKPKTTPNSVPLHLYLFIMASFIICTIPAMLILASSLSEYNCYSYAVLENLLYIWHRQLFRLRYVRHAYSRGQISHGRLLELCHGRISILRLSGLVTVLFCLYRYPHFTVVIFILISLGIVPDIRIHLDTVPCCNIILFTVWKPLGKNLLRNLL